MPYFRDLSDVLQCQQSCSWVEDQPLKEGRLLQEEADDGEASEDGGNCKMAELRRPSEYPQKKHSTLYIQLKYVVINLALFTGTRNVKVFRRPINVFNRSFKSLRSQDGTPVC